MITRITQVCPIYQKRRAERKGIVLTILLETAPLLPEDFSKDTSRSSRTEAGLVSLYQSPISRSSAESLALSVHNPDALIHQFNHPFGVDAQQLSFISGESPTFSVSEDAIFANAEGSYNTSSFYGDDAVSFHLSVQSVQQENMGANTATAGGTTEGIEVPAVSSSRTFRGPYAGFAVRD